MNNSDVTSQRVFSSEGLGTNDALRRPVVNLSDVQVQAVISEKDLATQFADFGRFRCSVNHLHVSKHRRSHPEPGGTYLAKNFRDIP